MTTNYIFHYWFKIGLNNCKLDKTAFYETVMIKCGGNFIDLTSNYITLCHTKRSIIQRIPKVYICIDLRIDINLIWLKICILLPCSSCSLLKHVSEQSHV